MLSTIARTGSLLTLFTSERPEWGVREVAMHLSVPKSNAHDLLSSLAAIGMLQRTPEGRYRLGWRVLTMARSLVCGSGLERQSHLYTATLARHVGYSATLAAWDGHRIVCIVSARGRKGAELPGVTAGARMPGHSTALGKMLLAHRPWEEVVDRIERYGLPRQTADTVACAGALEEQLESVRRTGASVEVGETFPGVACFGAPIHDVKGTVVAALSISMPAADLAVARVRCSDALDGAARRLTATLAEADGMLADAPAMA